MPTASNIQGSTYLNIEGYLTPKSLVSVSLTIPTVGEDEGERPT